MFYKDGNCCMNVFEKFIYFLQGDMEVPKSLGWFHIMCLIIVLCALFVLYKNRKSYNEKQLKVVLGIYGIVALILEIGKQLIWSFNYDTVTKIVTWDYQWYSFPFQLCTTPLYVSILCLFLKKSNLRDALLSYISYITILGSIVVIVLPDSCFTSDILVNVHTMWLHLGSFVISIYLLITKEVKIELNYLKKSYIFFLVFTTIAFLMNVFVYNFGVLNGEEFNMFFISPYFISSLPVFNFLQSNLPYTIYLIVYITTLMLGGLIIYNIAKLIKYLNKKVGFK